MNYLSEQFILIYIVIALTLLEFMFPRVKIKITDTHFREDAKWYIFNEHIIKTFLMFSESSVILYLSSLNLQNRIVLSQQNIIFQVVTFILIHQFVGYWLHRLTHTSDFLWQFHKLHHSPTKLTATTNFRFSWVEELVGGALAVAVIGFFQFSENIISVVFIV
jgi:sterol desaturase/sphingolipid hydroxylase (fatty acid hydroxylase superfamily)